MENLKTNIIYTLRKYQNEAVDVAVDFLTNKKKENGIEVLSTGCHNKGTGIIMFDGSIKFIEDIKIGDMLMGPNNEPRNVMQLYKGEDEFYKITPLRGAKPFLVNKGHMLSLMTTNEEKHSKYPCHTIKGNIEFISVENYLNKSKSWKHLRKLHRSNLLEFKMSKELLIPPYILGVILGDGCTVNGSISVTTPDEIIANTFIEYGESYGLDIRIYHKENNKAKSYYLSKKEYKHHRGYKNPIVELLRKMKLGDKTAEFKFIPEEYIKTTSKNRLEILAGLLDTDGYLGSNCYDFISKSPQLASGVAFIVRSLGLTVKETLSYKTCQTGAGGYYYRISISGNTDIIPCRIPYKKASPRQQKKNALVTGFSIESSERADFYGFLLDGDHQYITSDFIIHHNSGKSLILANIAKKLGEPLIQLQPSKEILEQNYDKLISYGFNPAIYSASLGKKEISTITLATIGSVVNKPELFKHFKYLLIDECDLVNSKTGVYKKFIESLPVKCLGVTATPFRLSTDGYGGSMLKFITRTRPKIFDRMIYYTQNIDLFNDGYLAKLKYYSIPGFDSNKLKSNSTGADYKDESVQKYYTEINFPATIIRVVGSLMKVRKNVLVFTRFVDEAYYIVANILGSAIITAETPKKERERILTDFKAGIIKVVANVGILQVGFDYPELDTVVIARPTMSLRLYYQMIGRVMRPHNTKEEGWVIDMGDNFRLFGRIEDMMIKDEGNDKWIITSNGKKLTNQYYER